MLKKHLKLIIFILVCLITFLIYKNNNKNDINYLALGDELALGVNSYNIIDYSYADHVKDYLKSTNHLNKYIKTYSEKNLTIEKLYYYILLNKEKTINNKKVNLKEALRQADVVTLTIGINDLKYKLSLVDNSTNFNIDKLLQEITHSYDLLFTELQKYYQGKIYFIGYYPSNAHSYLLNHLLKRVNETLKANSKIIYIDTTTLFDNNHLEDNPANYYPNSLGYQKISELIIKELNKNSSYIFE